MKPTETYLDDGKVAVKKPVQKVFNYAKQGASTSLVSFKGWKTELGSPISDIDENIEKLRERSRDLFHAGSLGAGIPKTICTNVLGSGLIPKPQIDFEVLGIDEETARTIQKKIVREWKIFSKECDALRRDNLEEIQQTALMSQLINGDVGISIQYSLRKGERYGTKVLVIEADRIDTPPDKTSNPNIRKGVEFGELGEIVAYHVYDKHPSDSGAKVSKRVEAYTKDGLMNFWMLLDVERVGQYRGVPVIAQSIEKIKQLDRYMNAELMSAVISGMFTAVIESDKEEADIFDKAQEEDMEEVEGETKPLPTPSEPAQEELQMNYGAVWNLAPGQKLSQANPIRPNSGFGEFVKAMLQFIGATVNLPYELLVKHYDASYSASRGAVLEAEKFFKIKRNKFGRDYMNPLYEIFMNEVVAMGYIEEIDASRYINDRLYKEAILEVFWIGPKEGQLNPMAEAKANEVAVLNGWTTNEIIASTVYGTDFESNAKQLKVERQKLANINSQQELGVKINETDTTQVTE